MKKMYAVIYLIVGIICCSLTVYADDLNISGDMGLCLNPYKNFKDEGQISSNDIIITNNEKFSQTVSFTLVDRGYSDIALKNKSVLSNDYKDEKAAFVHIKNVYTNEKYLIYDVDKPCVIGVINPNESLCFKICGELNVSAPWEAKDSLELNIMFSTEKNNTEEIKTIDTVTSDSATEAIVKDEHIISEKDNTEEYEEIKTIDTVTSSSAYEIITEKAVSDNEKFFDEPNNNIEVIENEDNKSEAETSSENTFSDDVFSKDDMVVTEILNNEETDIVDDMANVYETSDIDDMTISDISDSVE